MRRVLEVVPMRGLLDRRDQVLDRRAAALEVADARRSRHRASSGAAATVASQLTIAPCRLVTSTSLLDRRWLYGQYAARPMSWGLEFFGDEHGKQLVRRFLDDLDKPKRAALIAALEHLLESDVSRQPACREDGPRELLLEGEVAITTERAVAPLGFG